MTKRVSALADIFMLLALPLAAQVPKVILAEFATSTG